MAFMNSLSQFVDFYVAAYGWDLTCSIWSGGMTGFRNHRS